MIISHTTRCLSCEQPFGFEVEVSMKNNAVNVKCLNKECNYINEFLFKQAPITLQSILPFYLFPTSRASIANVTNGKSIP